MTLGFPTCQGSVRSPPRLSSLRQGLERNALGARDFVSAGDFEADEDDYNRRVNALRTVRFQYNSTQRQGGGLSAIRRRGWRTVRSLSIGAMMYKLILSETKSTTVIICMCRDIQGGG